MQAPRPLRNLFLVLAFMSATACSARVQAAASPPLVETPVRPAASASAPASQPAAAVAASASTPQAYSPTPMSPPVTGTTGAVMTTGEGPIFIAMEKGYFRDEGIENVMQEFAGPQM